MAAVKEDCELLEFLLNDADEELKLVDEILELLPVEMISIGVGVKLVPSECSSLRKPDDCDWFVAEENGFFEDSFVEEEEDDILLVCRFEVAVLDEPNGMLLVERFCTPAVEWSAALPKGFDAGNDDDDMAEAMALFIWEFEELFKELLLSLFFDDLEDLSRESRVENDDVYESLSLSLLELEILLTFLLCLLSLSL